MIRGLVYSLISVCLFLCASIAWMLLQQPEGETLYLLGGWMILIGFFAVGPAFFVIGYWHHRHLYPNDPHWDGELGE